METKSMRGKSGCYVHSMQDHILRLKSRKAVFSALQYRALVPACQKSSKPWIVDLWHLRQFSYSGSIEIGWLKDRVRPSILWKCMKVNNECRDIRREAVLPYYEVRDIITNLSTVRLRGNGADLRCIPDDILSVDTAANSDTTITNIYPCKRNSRFHTLGWVL